jgi:hypothetical protein
MTTTQTHSTFDPTLAMAMDRARTLHTEAHQERLAASGRPSGRTSLRTRVGQTLIDLGSAIATPAGTRQPSLTD